MVFFSRLLLRSPRPARPRACALRPDWLEDRLVPAGAVTSQGDAAILADQVRQLLNLDGTGVTVGVISDSYNLLGGASADAASGDLPGAVGVLSEGGPGGNDEGRAMLQVVHDIAPGARLLFAAAGTSQAQLAASIRALANAGADIIVDDVTFPAEPMFQDGIVAQAVDQVAAAGVVYFSAAGNLGRQSYQSAYVNSGVNLGSSGTGVVSTSANFLAHDFDPGAGVDLYQTVTLPAGRTTVSFQWSDRYASAGGPGAQTDMDLALFDMNGVFLSLIGGFTQNTGADPTEVFDIDAGAGGQYQIALGKFSGPDPAIVKYVAFADGFVVNEYATDSSTVFGHANAAGAAAVGAARYTDTPRFGTDPPAARPFTGRGGTPILFDTAGNPQSPSTRPEPRFVAPDGVNTTFFGATDDDSDGLPNFIGTSAAAPHAAGVAALMLQANRSLTPTQVYSALAATALDIGPAGFDADTGAGLIQALPAVLAVGGPFDVTLAGTAADDTFLVRRDSAGANVEFLRNGRLVLRVPATQLGRVSVYGGAGTDSLTLDYVNGAPLASAGLSFAGGETAGDGDRLVLAGYDVETVVVNHDGPETGTVQVGTTGLVSFAEIEPLVLTGVAADLIINLPTTPNPDVAVGDDGGPADPDGPAGLGGFSAVSGSTFEYTRFRSPTRGLTVTLGGGDTVALRPMDPLFAPSGPAGVTVAGGTGADTVTLFGDGGDDAVAYTPDAADGGVVTVTRGAAGTRYTLRGVESLAADGLAQAGADAVSVSAPRLAVAFGLPTGSGTITPASVDGLGWLPLAYRNFERAAVAGTAVAVAATAGDDAIGVAADGTVTVGNGRAVRVTAARLDLDGLTGTDSFTVSAAHPFSDGVTVNTSRAAGGAGSITVVGSGGAVTATPGLTGRVVEAGHGVVQYAGLAAAVVNAGAGSLTVVVEEGQATTTVLLTGGGTATVRIPDGSQLGVTAAALTVVGPTSSDGDRLRVSAGVSGGAAVTIGGGAVRFADLLPVAVGSGVDAVEVVGGTGDDTFTVTPGPVPVFVDGGPHATGDRLAVAGAVAGRPTPGSGTIGPAPGVTYQNIETVALGSVPSPAADAVTTGEGGAVTIAVLGNDAGLGDGPFTVTIDTPPLFGTAVVSGTAVVYTPSPGYTSAAGGPDAFRYRVEDANGDAAVGTVTVTVAAANAPPVAFTQSLVLAAGDTVTLTLMGDDANRDVIQALTYTILTPPARGALSAFDPATGRVTYTPAPGFDGPDAFTFAVTDDATAGGPARTSAAATVFLQTNRVNRPPVAAADAATVPQGGFTSSPDGALRANDADPDGDPLVVSLVTGPARGTLALDRRGTYTYTPDPAFHGTDSFVYAVADGRGGSASATVTITVTPAPVAARRFIATGAGVGGGPHVKVFDAATGEEVYSFFAYDSSFRGGVRVAVGDVNGDGVPDIVTSPGPGGGPHIRAFSGTDLAPLASFFAFDPNFRSGANVAVGDLDADGIAEVVAAAAPGGGSHVRAFDIREGREEQIGGPLGSFFAFAADFTGGVSVAVGDYDGVAGDEIIVGSATRFPQVRVYGRDGAILTDFLAFDVARVGVTVAAGDVDGDGRADVIVGPGDGGGPVVRVFRAGTNELIGETAAFDLDLRGGISVAATPSRTEPGRAVVVVAPTQQARAVQVYDPQLDGLLGSFDAYAADFPGGVFVGAG